MDLIAVFHDCRVPLNLGLILRRVIGCDGDCLVEIWPGVVWINLLEARNVRHWNAQLAHFHRLLSSLGVKRAQIDFLGKRGRACERQRGRTYNQLSQNRPPQDISRWQALWGGVACQVAGFTRLGR